MEQTEISEEWRDLIAWADALEAAQGVDQTNIFAFHEQCNPF